MSISSTFQKNIESTILKEGFQRRDPSKWGTYFRMGSSFVDWIQSPSFVERNGKVGILVSRSFFEIESVLQFVIARNILTFHTFHDSESWENTIAQFPYDENGVKQASEYLANRVFGDALVNFDKYKNLEEVYHQHQISSNPFLQTGLEPSRGAYAIYRDLLMAKMYKPNLYASKFEAATNHFNQIIKDYSETLKSRNQELTIDPIKTNTSKLGRLDLFLALNQLASFEATKKQLIDNFIRNIKL